jgi:hypothetical protein
VRTDASAASLVANNAGVVQDTSDPIVGNEVNVTSFEVVMP